MTDASREVKLAVFEDKQIRRIFHKGEWYFSIIDIVEVLTGSSNPRRYWSDLKTQITEGEGFVQLYGKIVQLKLLASDGKMRETDTANTETVFRIKTSGRPDVFIARISTPGVGVKRAYERGGACYHAFVWPGVPPPRWRVAKG